mgnify:CR=1 FL=1|jgi:hypothetical protein|tara:strand:+ start:2935 stop:3720 length:786 start_codon:yes stop_codon:yes gene_type:complete
MFGTYFYHQRIRKSVAVFGAMFNNLYVLRKNAAGATISQIKVPLSYAPKRSFIDRIANMQNGEEAERLLSVKLPRMSFEITNFNYDSTRQLTKIGNYNLTGTTSSNRNKFFSPVPYTISFQLNVYAKTHDDALQIVEQIVPYFNPQYVVTIKPITDFPDVKEDSAVILNSVTFSDDYEGSLEQRRSIIYTLDFDMKISFYGPINTGAIIRQADAQVYNMLTGLTDSDELLETIRVIPNPSDASPDSDYGFTTLVYEALDSA